jgi:branched-chain amino acid transport system permease protein
VSPEHLAPQGPSREASAPERRARPRLRRGSEAAAALGLALAVLLAPFYVGSEFNLRIATITCVFATMALGWNLLGGYANQFSLGHATFFALGAYGTGLAEVKLGLNPWLGVLLGLGLAVLVALVIGVPTFRLSGHYFALATLVVPQIGLLLFTYYQGITNGPLGVTLPIRSGNSLSELRFSQPIWYYYVAAVMLLLALLLSRQVLFSRFGYRLRAIKGNPLAAQLAGVDLFRAKLTAAVISAATVAVAGGVYMQYIQYVDPATAFSFDLSVGMALYAIIGGTTVWWGPALGALILVPLSQYTSLSLTGQLAPIGPLLYGLILIAVILVRPRGIGSSVVRLWERLWAGRGAAVGE